MTHTKSLLRLAEMLLLPIGWMLAILASLSLHQTQLGDEHSICGPWGCGPPTSALIAVHSAWAFAILLPALLVPRRFALSRPVGVWASRILLMVGLGGIIGITLWQWLVWMPQAGEWARPFIWKRCAFSIATTIDWPVVQLFFAGILVTPHKRTPNALAATPPTSLPTSVEKFGSSPESVGGSSSKGVIS